MLQTDELIQKLSSTGSLEENEYAQLIKGYSEANAERLKALADAKRREIYGNEIFIRGLIEVSNICRNDCIYCGIRRSNRNCDRYRLTPEEILAEIEEFFKTSQ